MLPWKAWILRSSFARPEFSRSFIRSTYTLHEFAMYFTDEGEPIILDPFHSML